MDREKIADMVFCARTWEECVEAEKALTAWLREHPKDWEMYDLGGQLAVILAARREEREHNTAEAQRQAA